MTAPTPHFDYFRKQAKLLLKQHREGYYPVCQRIRKTHPRFTGVADKAILQSPFALYEAQEIIAKEQGFGSWAALKKELPQMSKNIKETKTAQPHLSTAYPMIFVTDLTKAAEYYRDKLGFKVDYLYGEPPFYGMVTRDGASLHLRHVDKHPLDRTEKDLLSVAIVVQEVKALFLEFKAKGVEFHQTLKEQPWGTTDFIVRDPDGNLLSFASEAKKA